MDFVAIIGFIAAFLTTGAFLPQVVKTLKLKETRDISFFMYILFCLGVLMWLTYGLLISSWPIIAANSVTLTLASIVLFFKIKYG